MTDTTIVGQSNGGSTGVSAAIPLAKRSGVRSLLPETWLGRAVRVSYADCFGGGQELSGVLLDWCGTGPVFSLEGERTVLAWDALVSVALIDD